MFVCCLMTYQHADASQEGVCIDNWACCRTETKVLDQACYLSQSQYSDGRG